MYVMGWEIATQMVARAVAPSRVSHSRCILERASRINEDDVLSDNFITDPNWSKPGQDTFKKYYGTVWSNLRHYSIF